MVIGLAIPDGTVGVRGPGGDPSQRQAIYMYNTGTSHSASNTANTTHGVQYFGGADSTYIGQDPAGGRFFNGVIDDVRIYDYALERPPLEAMAVGGGKAVNPGRVRVARRSRLPPICTGSRRLLATAHDVYFGTSYTAVLNATTASPEYKGRQTAVSYHPTMTAATTYYWRVDEVAGDAGYQGRRLVVRHLARRSSRPA